VSFANDLKRVRSRRRRLEKVLEGRGKVLIASHNNPDPDSIVSSLLLEALLERSFGLAVTLSYSGVIGRAENKALLDLFGVRLVPLNRLDVSRHGVVALVDTQPGTGSHSFEDPSTVDLVFDHHRLRSETRRVGFFDVRESFGTTTTLLYLYARAWGLEIDATYATGMLYALRSETADMGRDASLTDRRLFKDLYAIADLRALSKIVNAKVGTAYFEVIHEAIERSVAYGRLIVVRMDEVPYPDAVSEIADYFLKYRKASTVLSIGVYGDDVLFSMRSDDSRAQLGRLALRIVRGLGTAGGHESSAGGQIPADARGAGRARRVQGEIVRRLLLELGLENERSRNLIRHIPPPARK
jgi:nanoRNase/pAp phosphatase (c-di-AMP/oligoRNAs hydrolase)